MKLSESIREWSLEGNHPPSRDTVASWARKAEEMENALDCVRPLMPAIVNAFNGSQPTTRKKRK